MSVFFFFCSNKKDKERKMQGCERVVVCVRWTLGWSREKDDSKKQQVRPNAKRIDRQLGATRRTTCTPCFRLGRNKLKLGQAALRTG